MNTTMSSDNPWKTISSRAVYKNPWFSVREDQVIRPDGTPGIYGVVELPSSVGVVAISDRDEVALVKQWRYVHGRESLEIPTGGTDADDKQIIDAARRELFEETGLKASRWYGLGTIENSNGATTDIAHLFLATQLTHGPKPPIPDEAIVLVWLPIDEAVEMALDGRISESTSVAALLRGRLLGLDSAAAHRWAGTD